VRRYLAAVVVLLGLGVGPARAWNDKGHMVIARLAWKGLTPDERAAVVGILKAHPHYDEFLKAQRPEAMTEDEWVFLRAATWADWVRSGPPDRRAFNRPPRHYINLPFVPAGAAVTPKKPDAENVVTALGKSRREATAGGDRVERAVAVTWLFHLAGDIAQPLHCSDLVSDRFPTGDRGGTRSRVRLGNELAQLHAFWDGLLGSGTTPSAINAAVLEVEALLDRFPEKWAVDVANHTTFAQWAEEGSAAARTHAYLNGRLDLAPADGNPAAGAVTAAPDDYARSAGEYARFAAGKAGKRLAAVLREVVAANAD
jgi:hypothetical protein